MSCTKTNIVKDWLDISGSWGLKVPADRVDPQPVLSVLKDEAAGYVSWDWLTGYRPGQKAQVMGSCTGRGAMNLAEIMIQNHCPGALADGDLLDGDALYLWLRDHYYGDQDPDGGANLEEVSRALVEAGVLPPDTTSKPVSHVQSAITTALQDGPILQGSMVDEAWKTPSRDGEIEGVVGDYLGGHCTVLLGQWYYTEQEAHILGGNSWGDDWSWHGIFRLGWARWLQTIVELRQVVVNHQSMQDWTGFKKWLIPQGRTGQGSTG